MTENRKYIEFDPSKGYPASGLLFYECLLCGGIVLSWPAKSISCRCLNIRVDPSYGRMAVNDPAKIRLFSRI